MANWFEIEHGALNQTIFFALSQGNKSFRTRKCGESGKYLIKSHLLAGKSLVSWNESDDCTSLGAVGRGTGCAVPFHSKRNKYKTEMEWVRRGVDSTVLIPRMNKNQECYFYKL